MSVSSVRIVPLASLLLAVWALDVQADPVDARPSWVFFGTYTGGRSEGIYRGEFDPATGRLTNVALAAKLVNPSYLAIHPSGRFLYAIDEIGDFGGKRTGAVTAFTLDPRTGVLGRINQQASGGAGPCHLVIDGPGRNVLVANYGGGSAAVLPIESDGRLQPASSVVQHQGSSVNRQRQEAPHAHSINLDPAGRFVAVADLGLDQILLYRFNGDRGTLTANEPPYAKLPPGAGPRHFAFHRTAPYAYAINELNSTVTAFAFDSQMGTLASLQTVRTVPDDFKGENYPADVQVHPAGRILYGSNRGHDSIAVFTIDSASGRLNPRGQQRTGIKVPRGFGIDPTGGWLVVGNQDADNAAIFRINSATGDLEPAGTPVEVPKPVCVKFLPIAR